MDLFKVFESGKELKCPNILGKYSITCIINKGEEQKSIYDVQ